MSVKKMGNKWIVTDSGGKKVLGTHDTEEKAKKQLTAIELSKLRRKGKDIPEPK